MLNSHGKNALDFDLVVALCLYKKHVMCDVNDSY